MRLDEALQIAGMSKREYMLTPAMADYGNWSKLHPALAELKPDLASIQLCRALLVQELVRADGPRPFYVDRLYKRMSNLRREMERAALEPYLRPEMAEAA